MNVLIFLPGKVFVTYATDNDKHVGEVINFVALLMTNGFETQVGFVMVSLQLHSCHLQL